MTGIKEETSGTITLDGDYVIDFNNLENGSDLWLFSQITDFGKELGKSAGDIDSRI